MIDPVAPIGTVKGVGDFLSSKFATLGINTVQELIENVPRRYDDFSQIITVSQIRPGQVSLKVQIGSVKARYSKNGIHITEAMATDSTGGVKLIWFNQMYRSKSIQQDKEYFVSGEFGQNYKYFAITNPACELVSSFPINTARMVPIYKLTKGLGVTQIRKVIKNVLQNYKIPETLPDWLVGSRELISKSKAINEMHFPSSDQSLEQAKRRLGFEEVFELTLASELNKQLNKKNKSQIIPFDEGLIKTFVSKLPFKLTNAQRKAAWQIFQDMESGVPMNRLVEGDVGSGKTVVAVMAAIGVMNKGSQVAIMAPTEILATQHAESVSKILKSINLDNEVLLLTGSMSTAQKENAVSAIVEGKSRLIVGTHAIFQKTVFFKDLALVIIDEQHRFGVEQRKLLQSKAKHLPHVLSMTATPIPRSLALTLYGEMETTIIDELPAGRKTIETTISIAENRPKIYEFVASQLDSGRQAFVVCPQIEETEKSRLSVKKIHTELSKKYLSKYRVGLLHGRMKSEEKDQIMKDFINHKIDVLVSTTVIEVGVDVPNANIIVIEGADSFGLAQLHQLRGRVGRGSHESYCKLVLSDNSEPSSRLKLLEYENNGFKLADYDLEQRGPGAIYGTMQHGALDLRVAKLSDIKLINLAKEAAKEFIKRKENLLEYSELKVRVDRLRTITNLN